ncbi:hypothetical protein [uncultured Eubacterium sp.]|uniref:hypothetical protein n=1 Tax=uncultured Eubacterium sp. TaxID=165185 RepID=UPI002594B8E0|nr:hypothetical protein [uncultured Eubacterium sp.]
MANKVTDLFKKSSSYDKKHIKNLSTKKVPAALLQAVEKGCSFETLEKLAKGFPICKYQTQITVHGIFDDPSTRCVGFYVNLTKNKNQSLGIRWTAIDHEKKEKLFSYIKLMDNEWQIKEDSSSFYMCKMVRVSSQEALLKAQERYQAEVDKIDVNLFTGSANVFKLEGLWGVVYVGLSLVIQCFPEGRFWQIAENITGKKKAEILAAEAAKIAEEKKRDEEREAEWKKRREEADREHAAYEARREAWKAKNPAPAGFKKVQNYTFQPGDIELLPPEAINRPDFEYGYRIFYKSFGRLCVCHCDAAGNRLYKQGCMVGRKTVAEAYVKKAS